MKKNIMSFPKPPGEFIKIGRTHQKQLIADYTKKIGDTSSDSHLKIFFKNEDDKLDVEDFRKMKDDEEIFDHV